MSPSQMGMATVFLGAAVAAATAFAANAIYWVCSAVFLAEYLLRIWLTPQQERRPDDT